MGITFKSPCAELIKLENLWLQLSNVACNIKCKHCYLDCHQDIKKKNFLSIEKITEELKVDFKDLKRIYLTGGEPFLHPKINEIIKLSLKKAEVIICTNGTLVNEKKIKNIKNIEEIMPNNIIFRFSLDHFTEGRNDEYRAHGVFKKVLNALKLAQLYEIKSEITCVNLKNDNEEILKEGFLTLFKNNKLNLTSNNIKIVPMLNMGNYAKYYHLSTQNNNVTFADLENFNEELLDCKSSRVLTINGIYSCPALVGDPRGKVGENISKSAKNVYLETPTCYNCISRKEKLFG